MKNKYLLLAILLIAVFALPGCRTRITNNSDVSNVYLDEDGFLTETYQMRRDELGLSTADKPILPDLGSGDMSDDFDSSEETNFNYAPEEDTYVEPPTTTNTTTNTNSSTTTGRRYSYRPSTSYRTSNRSSSSNSDKVTVTFDPGSGKIENKTQGEKTSEEFDKNSYINALKAEHVTWEGHQLVGWMPSDGTGVVSPGARIQVKNSVTYKAVWDPPEDSDGKIKVTFDPDGGTVNPTSKEVKTGDKYGVLPTPTKDGFTFDGWYTEKNGKGNKIGPETTCKRTQDRTLYAYWKTGKSNNETYTVRFEDGQGKLLKEEKVEKGKSATAPSTPSDPTGAGREFAGWDNDFSKVTSDLVVKAKWNKANGNPSKPEPANPDEKEGPFKVKFEDGNGKVLDTQTVQKGGAAKAPATPSDPKGAGRKFAGWDKDFSNVTSNMTVTAKWDDPEPAEPEEYEITLNFNDGTSNSETIKVNKDGTYGPLPTPDARPGYNFNGWKTEDGKTVKEGDKIVKNEPHNLIADWPEKTPARSKWTEIRDAARDDNNKKTCYVEGDGDLETWIQDAGTKKPQAGEMPEIAITFADNKDAVGEKRTAMQQTLDEKYPGNNTIIYVLSSNAKSNANSKLAYSIGLLNRLQEAGLDEDTAAEELIGESISID